ncbi:hypothetical protein J2Z75_002743 [Rhizobium herbae]|uniref:Uncharacterized protein n=1 Tax=Rhizobium herbae TaxID=508661 RepID=A0ABS4EMQ8_9HYPH|nr:hypothetical protein [Rhizobium herbae]
MASANPDAAANEFQYILINITLAIPIVPLYLGIYLETDGGPHAR